MNTSAKIQLKIRDFYKKYKKIIFIILLVWTTIFIINQFIKVDKDKEIPETTYTPHVAVINEQKEVPKKLQQPIEKIIDDYFNYCNKGEYEKAYNMLSDECKENYFTTQKKFEEYIKQIFGKGGKIYNIQDYSNLSNTYIYNIRILDDILANGTTTGYGYYEEKITIKGDKEDNLKLNIGNFIGQESMTVFAEDDYLKIEVLGKSINYDTETYKVKIKNKSEYTVVLADNMEKMEIAIYIGDQVRVVNLPIANIKLNPNSTQTLNLEFSKFADDGKKTSKLIFNAIRVLPEYSGNTTKYEQEISKAIKLYSLTIDL